MLRNALNLLLLTGMLAACGDQAQDETVEASFGAEQPVQLAATSGPDLLTPRQMQQWLHSCALCHVTGVAAAPLVGNIEQWQSRWQQGRSLLLAHTVEGFNDMPPLGYCMSCEADDFSAMIDFMAGDAK